jgi:dihydrofolate reductase
MKLIVACDPKGGIGYKNKLPWDKIQGDLPRFKRLTDDCVIVMGRKTWESLPKKPLPNRTNLIITSQLMVHLPDDAFTTMTIDDITDDAWIIGGAQLINSSWEKIHEVHLTKTYTEYTCDVFIDLLYLENNFVRIHNEVFPDHEYQIWKRK